MIKEKRMKVSRFQVDQEGVDELKDRFFNESRDFVYFRKGEWTGFEHSIVTASSWIAENPEWVITAIALYPGARKFVKDIIGATGATNQLIKRLIGKRNEGELIRTCRVIVSEGRLSKKEIKRWEDICGKDGVVITPKEQGGYFRYLVNEHRYAIFSRLGPDKLQGIMGTDKQTIRLLRNIFDREFIEGYVRIQDKKK